MEYYEISSGSTIITLNQSYLKTFSNGTYNFRAEFTDGYADLTLVVDVLGNKNKDSDKNDNPNDRTVKTGDDTPIGMLFGLIALAGIGLIVIAFRRKNIRN